jgi:hypothetical protein
MGSIEVQWNSLCFSWQGKYIQTLAVQHSSTNQILDRAARHEIWVELHQRVGPERAVAEVTINVFPDVRITYVNKRGHIRFVFFDDIITKSEDIQPMSPPLNSRQ